MKQKEPGALSCCKAATIDENFIIRLYIEGGAFKHNSVHAHPARLDPQLGIAARTQPRTGHDFGNALRAINGMR
jgi:hypothetical protein